jgi:exodeoxyribonuclease VII small subunit|tara:strand:+ start:6239 stop:6496 length:258 start_codon:yes stop_codon:yes gene_type:complete
MSDKKKTAKSKEGDVNFEAAMIELEQLVRQMENGDLSLDESLKAFERGVLLTRQCQKSLAEAELKVKMLSAEGVIEDPDVSDLDA